MDETSDNGDTYSFRIPGSQTIIALVPLMVGRYETLWLFDHISKSYR